MRGAVKKVLMGLFVVFLVFLIANTATTTVADAYWGNLQVGDEMTWQVKPYTVDSSEYQYKYKMEILEISGEYLTCEIETTITLGGSEYTSSKTQTVSPHGSYLTPASEITGYQTETYTFAGSNYKAAYTTSTAGDLTIEKWWDYSTGIMFESRVTTSEGDVHKDVELLSTTADLTEAGGGCLGTILIALVSVTTLVSYSVLRNKKQR